MAIKKRSQNGQGNYTDYKHLKSDNISDYSNIPTNFDIKTITLEDCDRAVFEEFNKRFKIGEKFMPLILLDAEMTSIHMQNFEQYDKDKGFLQGPFFTMFRTKSQPQWRTNPTYKKIIYTVPKQKANGIVLEDWITEGPTEYNLIYEFKFITAYREYANEMETHMRHYFRNKRNIIICNNERFSIGPEDFANLASLDINNRETIDSTTKYILTFTLKLECFTRDMSTVQKRERPNTFILDMEVQDGQNIEKDTSEFKTPQIKRD